MEDSNLRIPIWETPIEISAEFRPFSPKSHARDFSPDSCELGDAHQAARTANLARRRFAVQRHCLSPLVDDALSIPGQSGHALPDQSSWLRAISGIMRCSRVDTARAAHSIALIGRGQLGRRHAQTRGLDPPVRRANRNESHDCRDQRKAGHRVQSCLEGAGTVLEPANQVGPDQAAEVAQ
jgi:hypothetical protein